MNKIEDIKKLFSDLDIIEQLELLKELEQDNDLE